MNLSMVHVAIVDIPEKRKHRALRVQTESTVNIGGMDQMRRSPPMNDSTRKLLTEMIGECWHNTEVIREYGTVYKTALGLVMVCTRCLKRFGKGEKTHRTFTTPDDQHAVMQAIVKAGKWEEFTEFIALKATNKSRIFTIFDLDKISQAFLDPSRFCELAGEWAEKERWGE